MQVVQVLGGHSSSLVATRSALLHVPAARAAAGIGACGDGQQGGRLLLASADEDSCCPWLWDVRGGPTLQKLHASAKPVLHLRAVAGDGAGGGCEGVMLLAAGGSGLQMYKWLYDAW